MCLRLTRDVEALTQLGAAAGGVDGEADQVQEQRHGHLDRHAVQAPALFRVLCSSESVPRSTMLASHGDETWPLWGTVQEDCQQTTIPQIR